MKKLTKSQSARRGASMEGSGIVIGSEAVRGSQLGPGGLSKSDTPWTQSLGQAIGIHSYQ